MYLDRGIVSTHIRSDNLSTIPNNPDNLTHQSTATNNAPRDPPTSQPFYRWYIVQGGGRGYNVFLVKAILGGGDG